MQTPDHVWVKASEGRFALRFAERDAVIEGVPVREIAERVGTPTYVYSAGHIEQRFVAISEAMGSRRPLVCYAVKANSNQAILHHLGRLGAGADIVSGGELARVLAAGIAPEKVVFSGVGKTDEEISTALRIGIRSINVESVEELARVAVLAEREGRPAPVSLRVNPDVDPATHPYLATGLRESKFGIAAQDALGVAHQAARNPALELVGLACHIGSQITDVSPYADALVRVRAMVDALREEGIALRQLDLGGGFGIAYGPQDRELDLAAWGRALREGTEGLDLDLVIEPGRSLVAHAGVLLTRVLFRKAGQTRSFVIVDGAMNDLIRPSLYGGYHAVVPLRLPADDVPVETVDVVGPVCESGDFLAKDRALHRCETGEVLAVLSSGAYGMVMSSNYNTRSRPAEVLVQGDRFAVVRRRETVEDQVARDELPPWVTP